MSKIATMTAAEIAETSGLTLRRVRQLAEEGKLIRCERGLYDASFAIHYLSATKIFPDMLKNKYSPKVMAFAAWLISFDIEKDVYFEDLIIAVKPRWEMDQAETALTLIQAAAYLGKSRSFKSLKVKR